jgi:hypothetical protein
MIISLCRECYVVTEAYTAQYGYRPDIGIDGWAARPETSAYERSAVTANVETTPQ